MPSAQQQKQEKKRAPGDSAPNPFGALYALLSDTRFAIIVIIASTRNVSIYNVCYSVILYQYVFIC